MRNCYTWLIGLLCVAPLSAGAQATPDIVIETLHTALVLREGKDHHVFQQYFGKKLDHASAYAALPTGSHQAYISAGMGDVFTPAVRMVHVDGNPSLDLQYAGVANSRPSADVTATVVTLKDPEYPVTVELHYEAYYKEDVLKAWTVITQNEKKAVKVSRYASAMIHFTAPHYWLSQFHGDWASEMKMQTSELTAGIKVIDSKLGTRADMYSSPVFLLALDKPATETTGEVIAGTLAWTGNYQFLFEVDQLHGLRLSAGINPYASDYTLAPGEKFTTPAFIFTYSDQGTGQASRDLHDWARSYDILDGKSPRLTLLNNWESTYFKFDEQKLVSLFDGAKNLGVDMFLLDDGWFGNKYARDNDHAGLGDWQVNRKKLPGGIGHLVSEAGARGLKFGIWVEPEMVNPKSELYEKHPDWILRLPNRPESYYRNQLVLDLTNPRVQDFVYQTVYGLFRDNPSLAYIKWDCNRMMTNTYSPYLGADQSNLYVDYVKGLYSVLKRIREKLPHVPMMLCSGGGGRTDYGALPYFTEFWASDNTDAFERVFIQWGYSYFFPSLAVCNHITSWGKESLKFRTDVAMMGKMGYDIRVADMSPEELAFSHDAVALYKKLSPVIWQGDLYRLISPYQENRAVLMYVGKRKDTAVVFDYNLHTRYKETFDKVLLGGLDAARHYRVREVNLFPGTKSKLPENGKVFSGDYLMTVGLDLSDKAQPLTSQVIELTAE